MKARTAALLLALCLVLAACGGSGSSGEETTATFTPSAEKALAKAEANCELMLKEVRHAAKGVLSEGYKNNLKLLTLGFGRPGLKIAERTRERQRKLIPAIDEPAYETYVGLFDPIIYYAKQSIKGAEVEKIETVLPLKEKLSTLGIEQGLVAHQAGLPACEISFLDEMVKAATQ